MRSTARALLRAAVLAAVAAALLLVTGLSQPAKADGPFSPAVVRIDPANQSVPVSTQVVVNIMLEDFPDPDGLGAYEVALTWNPNVLQFKCSVAPSCSDGFTNGPLLGSTGRAPTCLPPDRDVDDDGTNDPGYVKAGCLTFGAEPPGPTADGLLATLRFSTPCAGSTIITFDRVALSDPLAEDKPEIPGDDLQYNISGGNATVTGGEPCPAGGLVGDANCNGTVNAIDAAIILQFDAALLGSLACPVEADVNSSGEANALDALLVLQYDAGLLDQLPP